MTQETYVGAAEVQSLAFVDQGRLAVVPNSGGIRIYTLDAKELAELVGNSLSRDFTQAERQEYFDSEYMPDEGAAETRRRRSVDRYRRPVIRRR